MIANGVALFNSRKFWHAHEAWEELWLATCGEDKLFLQGLIQLAAAYHHVQRGTYKGAIRLFDAALEKLEPYPPGYAGVDRAAAVEIARRHRDRIARKDEIDASEYPMLALQFDSTL